MNLGNPFRDPFELIGRPPLQVLRDELDRAENSKPSIRAKILAALQALVPRKEPLR